MSEYRFALNQDNANQLWGLLNHYKPGDDLRIVVTPGGNVEFEMLKSPIAERIRRAQNLRTSPMILPEGPTYSQMSTLTDDEWSKMEKLIRKVVRDEKERKKQGRRWRRFLVDYANC